MRFVFWVLRLVGALAAVAYVAASPQADAAKPAAASASPSPAASPGASAPSGQSPNQPSGQSPGQSSSGGNTGGSLPIESTILAYEALQASANSIAGAIGPTLTSSTPPAKLIVATPNDLSAIFQLRVILQQARILNSRVDNVAHVLGHLQCAQQKGVKGPPRPSPLFSGLNLNPVGKLFASPADITAMVTAAASISAVTESVATASGNLGDVSLVNLVAGDLSAGNTAAMLAVYVPSMTPPHIYGISSGAPDLHGTYLYSALNNLEWSRTNLQVEANHTIGTKGCAKDPNLAAAKDLVVGATAAVDAFESSLFGTSSSPGGQGPAPTAGSAPAPASGAGSAQPNAPGPGAQAGSPFTSTAPVAQLLYIDLMIHQVAFPASNATTFLKDVYLLSVHALESGGSQLTHQQLFLGSRYYYSGGAVAAFALFNEDGSVMCTGVTYGYRGFIRADDFAHAITPLSGPVSPPGTNNVLPSTHTAAAPACRKLH